MDDDRWDEQVGSVADEAQRLLESLRRSGGTADPSGGDTPGRGPEGPDDAGPREGAPDEAADDTTWACTDPFCRSCPLCRTVAVARGLSPETLRRLADLATVAAGVLSDLARDRDRRDTPEDADPEGPGTDGPGGTQRTRRPSPPRPIPVRDADEGTSRG